MHNNPIARYHNYRLVLANALPACMAIDGFVVTDEELAVKCFREAVKHKKLDDSIMPDRHAVALIKQHLARPRE